LRIVAARTNRDADKKVALPWYIRMAEDWRMTMDKIEHVVLFLLENRSFDSLLGWLYEGEEPSLNIPPVGPGERRYDGLQGIDLSAFTNTDGRLSSPPIKGTCGMNVPFVDPGESFEHVNMQLFEKSTVAPGDSPTMKGYLRDYTQILEKSFKDYNPDVYGKMIMQAYTPAQIPILTGLARFYAVSDRWFCSVPSQTNANRAFSLCGTSMGLVDNGYFEQDKRRGQIEEALGDKLGDDRFKTKTIWNALHEANYDTTDDWMIFWQSAIIPESIREHIDLLEAALLVKSIILSSDSRGYLLELASGDLDSCYVHRLFPELKALSGSAAHFAKIDEFHRRARAGTLPRFSYIEPRWNIQQTAAGETLIEQIEQIFSQTGNDYHPPGNVAVGEEFLKDIYLSLTANEEAWKKTLLIITCDESVGQFDHVPPPAATPPWGDRTPQVGRDVQVDRQHGFNFDRYGARVPAILVSPYIPEGTVFRSEGKQPYDHTSLISTILKWLGLEQKIADFGERTLGAPTFEGVLTLSEPRTDAREVPFLLSEGKVGDPLRYYDRFYLQGKSGKIVSAAEYRGKVFRDDPSKAYFPTMGDEGMMLHVEDADDRPSTEMVSSGAGVKIITTDPNVGAYNVLGDWKDEVDCYYYNEYLTGEYAKQETWVIRRADGSSPILFGDEVTLTSQYKDQVLEEKGAYLKPKSGSTATWKVLPPRRSE
jgi:phospholipase C